MHSCAFSLRISGTYVTPPDLLLAQKFNAIFNRKRANGRDYFDAVFLLGIGTKPNYDYLSAKLDIHNPAQLRERLLDACTRLDFDVLASDVRPFLFDPRDEKKVRQFPAFIGVADLG